MNNDGRLKLPRFDYVSPGLTVVRPDHAFPNMIVGNTEVPKWRWLRRWVEHNWYTDKRNPDAGFASRDEAAILHNAALLVKGRHCLEIGCWRGWSAVHIALGSGMLDVIDPVFDNPAFFESIRQSCAAANVLGMINFHSGFSPQAVDALAHENSRRWALIFIDGEHEGDASRQDAQAAMRHADDDAMVFFHDLASPHVALGLHAMRDAGWHTMLYQTMQIMGVAWRGNIQPPDHVPDPNIAWTLPGHLEGYRVSGWQRPTIRSDGGWWADMSIVDRRDAAVSRAQRAEDEVTRLLGEVDVATLVVSQITAKQIDLVAEIGKLEDANLRLVADHSEATETLSTKHQAMYEKISLLYQRETRESQILQKQEVENIRASLQIEQELLIRALHLSDEWSRKTKQISEFSYWITDRRVQLGLLRRTASARLATLERYVAHTEIAPLLANYLRHWLLSRRTLIGLFRRSIRDQLIIIENHIFTDLRNNQCGEVKILNEDSEKNTQNLLQYERCLQEVHVDNIKISCQISAFGWDSESPIFSGKIGVYLSQCFRFTEFDKDIRLKWAKQIVVGFSLPESIDVLHAEVDRIRNSELFDAIFYERQTQSMGYQGDLALHYLLVGDALRLKPSASFDTAYYADRYPDLLKTNRLLHYLNYGFSEKRHIQPETIERRQKGKYDPARENVLLVVHETSRTGAPILGWNIARHLSERYNIFIVTLGSGALTTDFEAVSAEVYGPFDRARHHSIDIEYGLQPLLDEYVFKYALINSSESRAAIAPCVDRLIPTLFLMHEFGSYIHDRKSLCKAFDRVTEIVFPAHIVAQSSLDIYPALSKRSVRILPQGMSILPVNNTEPSAETSIVIEAMRLARAEGAFIILGAGTVDFRKGVDLFVATAMAVCRDMPDWKIRFLWVGHGYLPDIDMGYSVYLQEQLKRSGLQDHVVILGAVTDLEPIYAMADVFLLTSRLDPLPNVSIDAAHRAIPIVCFRDASGTAEILLTDLATAPGVVDHLDPVAAGYAIRKLVEDPVYYRHVADATAALASNVFDMGRYVDLLDGLGTAAANSLKQNIDDVVLLEGSDLFDTDFFQGVDLAFDTTSKSARRAVGQVLADRRDGLRFTAPGFNSDVWRAHHPAMYREPLAEFIRYGKPTGPWMMPVIRPVSNPSALEAPELRALLHVHLTQSISHNDLLVRLGANRLDCDLLLTTCSAAHTQLLQANATNFGNRQTRFVTIENSETSPLEWLLAEMRLPSNLDYMVVGHLHDNRLETDKAYVDFIWTALLGSRHPMLDCILASFATQPELGLAFPADPVRPDPGDTDHVAREGMFWARREVIQHLAADISPEARRRACVQAGFLTVVTHVPGVFR